MYFQQTANYFWVVDWSAEEGWHIDIDSLFPSSEIYSEEEWRRRENKKNWRETLSVTVRTVHKWMIIVIDNN